MKYSQSIGFAATLALMVVCFFPWAYIPSQHITITGFNAPGTNFGKPGLFNFVMGIILLMMFAVKAVWSKRTNVFIAALNLAWAFRNYLLLTTCLMGECPEKKNALYLLIGLAILIQLMALLPKLEISHKQ